MNACMHLKNIQLGRECRFYKVVDRVDPSETEN
jgi:hypothetical protein